MFWCTVASRNNTPTVIRIVALKLGDIIYADSGYAIQGGFVSCHSNQWLTLWVASWCQKEFVELPGRRGILQTPGAVRPNVDLMHRTDDSGVENLFDHPPCGRGMPLVAHLGG